MSPADIFRRRSAGAPARLLYDRVVAQARLPVFYAEAGVPDSVDGRFELVALHCFLLLRRLRADGAATAALRQKLFDWMFADMDASLRELGAGDLGVARRVKHMAKGFYGRIAAYDRGLDDPGTVLAAALRRNLYGTVEVLPEQVAAMADYVRASAAGLARQPATALLQGTVEFGVPALPQPARAAMPSSWS